MKSLDLTLLIALCLPFFAQAGTKTWSGGTSTDWATATNWVGNALPGSADDVIIPTSPAGGRMPTISANYTVKSITDTNGCHSYA